MGNVVRSEISTTKVEIDGEKQGRYDTTDCWVGRAIAGCVCNSRKVRAPKSTMPGNSRAGEPAHRATENDRRNLRPLGKC
jgi:hypothetical protein